MSRHRRLAVSRTAPLARHYPASLVPAPDGPFSADSSPCGRSGAVAHHPLLAVSSSVNLLGVKACQRWQRNSRCQGEAPGTYEPGGLAVTGGGGKWWWRKLGRLPTAPAASIGPRLHLLSHNTRQVGQAESMYASRTVLRSWGDRRRPVARSVTPRLIACYYSRA